METPASGGNDTTPALSVRRVRKEFDYVRGQKLVAIEDLSFDVPENQVCSLIGPSGCGKSTMLRMVAGLDEPTLGEVLVRDQPVTNPGRDRGMIFQAYTSMPWLSVRRNVEFGMKINGVPADERQDRAEEFMRLVGLAKFADSYPGTLSGGMRQRVALARTLANDPYMLLMDEPFGALDAITRGEMQELLLEVMEASKKTVILVTHDIEEALFLGDRVIFLSSHPGRLQADIDVPFRQRKGIRTHEELVQDPEFHEQSREILSMMRKESAAATEN